MLQHGKWEKKSNQISRNRLISRIHKEHLQMHNKKKNNSNLKMDENWNECFL